MSCDDSGYFRNILGVLAFPYSALKFNIVGFRQKHGVLIDFIYKLRKNPRELEILGDGLQRKSYVLVEECVDAMLYCIEHAADPVNIFNIGSQDQVTVSRIAEILLKELELNKTALRYTGGDRGWPGDVPKMMLSTEKLNTLGWKAKHNSEEAIKKASRTLINEIWKKPADH
jgi:UDP-glucose 4-epimerase